MSQYVFSLSEMAPPVGVKVADVERELVLRTLAGCNGNRTHAARALGLQRTYLLRLIRDLGVAAPPPPPRRRRPAA
jgi:DNA-binding NtrC family response regulator